jgi:hypothetical protein
LNNNGSSTKLGWAKANGYQVFRLSATWWPKNKVGGFGHLTIWIGSALRSLL